MATHFISYLTLILFFPFYPVVAAVNLTSLLNCYPELSSFTTLVRETSINADLRDRPSVTILAVPNNFLTNSVLSSCKSLSSGLAIQILLKYISPSDLDQIQPTGMLVKTLYNNNLIGTVNLTRDFFTGNISIRSAHGVATVLSTVVTIRNNVSVFAVNSLLLPCDSDLMASKSSPTQGTNITDTLIKGHAFNVVSGMLKASGVVEEFEGYEAGAGITLLMPTDSAFAASVHNIQSLSAYKKAVVLRFHVLHSYYPLGSLQSIVNPVQPTLATETMGAGKFTLNISNANSSVAISTGIVQATVTQTVFDEKPLVIFGVSKVLLPMEYFQKDPIPMQPPGVDDTAPPSAILLSPQKSPGVFPNSPPLGLGDAIRSGTDAMNILTKWFTLCSCMVLLWNN